MKTLIVKFVYFISLMIIVIITIVVVFIINPYFIIKPIHWFKGNIMSIKQVCKTWGDAPLDTVLFKKAHNLKNQTTIRAKMACSLLKNQKQYIGKTITEIRSLLGAFTGYYFIDMSPTYMIGHTHKKNPNSWQIVFLIDRNQKIAEIIVHKNCCSF